MKVCPQCNAKYEDGMLFCLEDGTVLQPAADPAATGPVTRENASTAPPEHATVWQPEVSSVQETAVPQSDRNASYFPPGQGQNYSAGVNSKPILGAFAGALVLLCAVVGGWWFLQRSTASVAVVGNVDQPPASPPNLISDNTKNGPTPGDSNLTNANRSNPKTSPAGEKPPVPKTISGGVLNGKAVNLVKPPYPPAARAVKAAGSVNVQVTIDEDGNVISASSVSGHPLLRPVSEAAARSSKFGPTMLSGQKVKVTGVIVYNFVP